VESFKVKGGAAALCVIKQKKRKEKREGEERGKERGNIIVTIWKSLTCLQCFDA